VLHESTAEAAVLARQDIGEAGDVLLTARVCSYLGAAHHARGGRCHCAP